MAVGDIPPREAFEILQKDPNAVYLDVRTEEEFERGHPVGAWNVPVVFFDSPQRSPTENADFLDHVRALASPDRTVIVGCQSGGRSKRATELLASAGFEHVLNVVGGFAGARDRAGNTLAPGWRDQNLPVATGHDSERCYSAICGPRR